MDAFALIKKIIRIYVYLLIIAWIVLSITFWMMIKQSDSQIKSPFANQMTGPEKAHQQMLDGILRIEESINYSIDRSSEAMHQITDNLPLGKSVNETFHHSINYWADTLKSFFQEVFEVARYAADEWLDEAVNLTNRQSTRSPSDHRQTKHPTKNSMKNHQSLNDFEPFVDQLPLHTEPITELTRSSITTKVVFDPTTQKTIKHSSTALYLSPARSNDQSFKLSRVASMPGGHDGETRIALSLADGLIRVTQKAARAA